MRVVQGYYGLQQQLQCEREQGGQEVRPDVDGFVVQTEDGGEAGGRGERFGPVVRGDEVVVFVPVGEGSVVE